MITLRKSKDRGYFDHGWLKTHHTFSFANYQDVNHMQFRSLRVINEDFVAKGNGFGTHPHRDMEILTYILAGELEHKDSMGNGSVIQVGDVQRMTAGTGVTHSEFNPSKEQDVHLLQIWILPEKANLEPSYEQTFFSREKKHNQLCLVASQTAENGSVHIHQDVKIFASLLDSQKSLDYTIPSNRFVWIQVAKGDIQVNGINMQDGDGCAISNEDTLKIMAQKSAEFLLFDLS